MMNHSEAYPDRTAAFFFHGASTEDEANLLRSFSHDYDILLKCDMCAHTNAKLTKVLNKIWWRLHPAPRLVFEMVKLSKCNPCCASLRALLHSIHCRWPDSRLPEDVHSKLRDESRRQRYTNVSRERRQFKLQRYDGLRTRKIQHLEVTDEQVLNAPPALKKRRLADTFLPCPANWPKELATIMLPNRKWTSPSPQSTYDGISAWQWLRHWWQCGKDTGKSIDSSWRSRLAKEGSVIRKATGDEVFFFLVVSVLEWGLLAWIMEPTPHPGKHRLASAGKPVKWLFVTDSADITVVPSEPVYVDGHGVLIEETGAPEPFVRSSIRAGVTVAPEDRHALLVDLGVSDEVAAASLKDDSSMVPVLEKVFDDLTPEAKEAELAHITALHTDGSHLDDSTELQAVWEAISQHDMDNASELKDIPSVIKKSLANAIQKLKAAAGAQRRPLRKAVRVKGRRAGRGRGVFAGRGRGRGRAGGAAEAAEPRAPEAEAAPLPAAAAAPEPAAGAAVAGPPALAAPPAPERIKGALHIFPS